MQPKKILIISETVLFPMDRGNRKRVKNLIDLLRSEGCTVDYLFMDTYPEDDPEKTREWIGADHFFSVMNRKRSFSVWCKRKVRKVLEILHIPFAFRYFSLDESTSPDLGRDLGKFFESHSYDQAWVVCTYNTRAFLSVPRGTLKVLETQNVSSVKRQEYDAVNYKNYIFAMTEATEKAALERSDVVIAIQNEEEDFFRNMLGKGSSTKAVTIGENMEIKEPHVADTKKVVFLGSTYVINREGVMHFIDEILPELKRICPEAEVIFAGSICKSLPDSDAYTKLGWVEDLEELYRDARVIINPVRHGAGLNIKMVEALSQAKPVVTHIKGMRGLSYKEPVAVITDDNKEFAKAIAEIVRDDAKALEMSRTAVEFMKDYENKNLQAVKDLLAISALQNT